MSETTEYRVPEDRQGPCVLCGKAFTYWGNNPEPLADYESGACCNECNSTKVIPARLGLMQGRSPLATDEAELARAEGEGEGEAEAEGETEA